MSQKMEGCLVAVPLLLLHCVGLFPLRICSFLAINENNWICLHFLFIHLLHGFSEQGRTLQDLFYVFKKLIL